MLLFLVFKIGVARKLFLFRTIHELILNDSKSKILDARGYIIMAELNGEVIGTCIFIKIEKYF